METIACIQTRRSIRIFKTEPVSHEIIEHIVHAASYAPSWKNTQIVRYTLVENPVLKEQIAAEGVMGFEYNKKTLLAAPCIMVVSIITGRCGYEKDGSFTTSKEDGWQMFDAGIASQTFCLAAHEYGIGTVIMGIFDEHKIAGLLALPQGQQVAALIACGYPDESPIIPKRKHVDELLRYC